MHRAEGKAGSLVDDRGHFYKPIQPGPRGDRERAFYELINSKKAVDKDSWSKGKWSPAATAAMNAMIAARQQTHKNDTKTTTAGSKTSKPPAQGVIDTSTLPLPKNNPLSRSSRGASSPSLLLEEDSMRYKGAAPSILPAPAADTEKLLRDNSTKDSSAARSLTSNTSATIPIPHSSIGSLLSSFPTFRMDASFRDVHPGTALERDPITVLERDELGLVDKFVEEELLVPWHQDGNDPSDTRHDIAHASGDAVDGHTTTIVQLSGATNPIDADLYTTPLPPPPPSPMVENRDTIVMYNRNDNDSTRPGIYLAHASHAHGHHDDLDEDDDHVYSRSPDSDDGQELTTGESVMEGITKVFNALLRHSTGIHQEETRRSNTSSLTAQLNSRGSSAAGNVVEETVECSDSGAAATASGSGWSGTEMLTQSSSSGYSHGYKGWHQQRRGLLSTAALNTSTQSIDFYMERNGSGGEGAHALHASPFDRSQSSAKGAAEDKDCVGDGRGSRFDPDDGIVIQEKLEGGSSTSGSSPESSISASLKAMETLFNSSMDNKTLSNPPDDPEGHMNDDGIAPGSKTSSVMMVVAEQKKGGRMQSIATQGADMSSLPFSVRNAPLLKVIPKFYGVRTDDNRILLELEDLARWYHHPCIMDIKIGFQTWYNHADPAYIERCRKKDSVTTQAGLGFKICGMQVYRHTRGGYWRASKRWCKTLPELLVDKALISFAHNEHGLRPSDVYGGSTGAVAQLQSLLSWFEIQEDFHFYSASILILYEGDAEGSSDANVRVRLVDFAHTFSTEDALVIGKDKNFTRGLKAVMRRFLAVSRLDVPDSLM